MPAAASALVTQRAQRREPRQSNSRRDKRKAARRKVLKTGKIHFGKSQRDLHRAGHVRDRRIDRARAIQSSVPDQFTLVLEMESAARKCTVVWRKDRQLGIQFG